MRTMVGLLCFPLLAVGFGIAQPQQHGGGVCEFTVQGEPAHPAITGPDDIVPLVYVVEQPDSPVEIVSVDLTGMWLSIANERHSENHCARIAVRNRSDRVVQGFEVELRTSAPGGGGGTGLGSSSPLAPGQTVEIKSCNGGGDGGAPGNHVRLLVWVGSAFFGECFYQPSLRIPRSLGMNPVTMHPRVWSDSPLVK